MASSGPTARLLICEDDPRFRRLLVKVLSTTPELEVSQCSSGERACELLQDGTVDLLLLDLELPGIDGIDVIRWVRSAGVDVEVLVLTSFGDEDRVFEAVRMGAAGYLVKGLAAGRLQQAIRDVLAGGTVIDARLSRRFWSLFAASRGREDRHYGLTPAEIEVLTLVARGLSNPEAASTLGASRRSIKAHLERIYRKLGVSSRVEATVKALQAGLIEL